MRNEFKIADINLAPEGHRRMEWAWEYMPVLRLIAEKETPAQPLAGVVVGTCLHLEAKTACLLKVLHQLGATVVTAGSNPLSTQDPICAALVEEGVHVFSRRGMSAEEYSENLREMLKWDPQVIIDDGGDVVSMIIEERRDLIKNILGGCEETTTGIKRLKAMAEEGVLPFPMLAVNDAQSKHLFDNRYGTGQSVWDAILRTTNLIVAGKNVVVSGYGWCGKGVALRAKGLGAKVIVTEVDPIRALEAVMDGYEVMPMKDAARVGDMFVTVTGCSGIITTEHFETMKDGAILTNAGHFDVEVDMAGLEKLAVRKYDARHNIQGYVLPNGKTLFTIAEGRLVNLAAGDGHPAEIMDMSFAVQALSAEYLAQHRGELAPDVIAFPHELDLAVARRKLRAMGVETDSLSGEQAEYLGV